MNKKKEFESDYLISPNSTSNNLSELNEFNNDIPSSISESFNIIKNNYNNNNNFLKFRKNKNNIGIIINYIFYNEKFINIILKYLNIKEISNFRALNHFIMNLVDKYLKIRFNIEIQSIISFQNENEKLIKSYMNNINEQIPFTTNNWLDLNLQKNISNLKILNHELITKVININNNKIEIPDVIYKSLLIIIGFNNKNIIDNEEINLKKFCNGILSNPNINEVINNIDYENINNDDIMEILKELNNPKLSISNIKDISVDYAKLILWLQTVVSFHILIHPYLYRNNKASIKQNSKEYFFANEMEKRIEKFYKLKRYLLYLNIININIGDYVFTIQYTNNHTKNNNIYAKTRKLNENFEKYNNDIYDNLNNSKIIGNILSYIPFKNSYKFRIISKSFLKGFKYSIDILLFSTIKELYFFRLKSYDDYIEEIPMIFSHNIFSKFFLMLDDILNGNNNELILKEVITEIKKLKSKNEFIYKISKIFCELIDIKSNKNNKEGKKDYIETLRMLAIKGELLKIMKKCNKLYFKQNKIYGIYNELKIFLDLKLLRRIKNINRAVYYILIWEILFLQYLRIFNFFDFVNFNKIKEKYSNIQTEFIENFLNIMDYLRYVLKIRFHFNIKNIGKKESLYGFKEAIDKLMNYLIEQNLTYRSDIIFSSTHKNFENIGNTYFNMIENKNNKCKNNILSFYERIINEIILLYNEDIVNNEENDNNFYPKLNNRSRKSKNAFSINSLDSIDNDDNTFNKAKYNNTIYSPKISLGIQSFNINKYKTKIYDIPDNIFIKTIFFYFDFNSLSKFGIANKKILYCFKVHMLIKLHFLDKNNKILQEKNHELINSINNKRKEFYSKYEINPPNKEHATKLINKLKIKDIQELKQYFKKYNKIYAVIIMPFILLLNQKYISKLKDENKLKVIFEIAKNTLLNSNNNNLIEIINSIEIELIPNEIINKIDELLKNNEYFRPEYMKRFNPCFSNLVSWIIGIIELYRILRKYSINKYDIETLEEKEIKFCKIFDDSILNYYKVSRYTNFYCKQYDKEAKELINQMDIKLS